MNRLSFDMLFYAIPTASLLCDAVGNILLANAAAENMLGFNAEKLRGLSVISLITDLGKSLPHRPSSLNSGLYQATILKHGKAQHINVQLTPLKAQDAAWILVSVFDDRRCQAENAMLNNLHALSQHAEAANAQSKLAALTAREREVMALAVAGYHNKEIARVLGISHRTVEIHKSKIMHKTGATNLLDLARIADMGNVTQLDMQ